MKMLELHKTDIGVCGLTINGNDAHFDSFYDRDNTYDCLAEFNASVARLVAAANRAFDHLDGCSHGYPDDLWDDLEAALAPFVGGGGEGGG